MVLLAAGALIAAASVAFLVATRNAGRSLRFGENITPLGGLTIPTRICIGLVGVLTGYHLIIWAFPPTLTSVQLTRDRWVLWAALGVGACALSFVVDRLERSVHESKGRDGAGKPE